MTDDKSKGVYGTRHIMEEEMRDAEQGVFETHSGESARKRRAAKKAPVSANKAAKPPANKAAG